MNVSVNCQHFMNSAPGETARSLKEALALCASAGFRFFDLATEDIAFADDIHDGLLHSFLVTAGGGQEVLWKQ